MRIFGSITALATPFTASGAIDRAAWRRLVAGQLEAGTRGLVVAGSTGEAAMLTPAEFTALVVDAVAVVAGRIPVLAGAGQSATTGTIEQCQRAQAAGADAVLVAAPSYVRPTQEGLYQHFEAVAAALGIPVVLYNVPTRTAVDLLPETVARLAPNPRIIGIKEAVPEPGRQAALLALRAPDFVVLGGDDGSACEFLLAGADGLVSVASNAAPASVRALCELARAGTAEAARALNAELAGLFAALSLEPNPIPVKAILAALGACENLLRLPLLPLSSRFAPELANLPADIRRLEARHWPAAAT